VEAASSYCGRRLGPASVADVKPNLNKGAARKSDSDSSTEMCCCTGNRYQRVVQQPHLATGSTAFLRPPGFFLVAGGVHFVVGE